MPTSAGVNMRVSVLAPATRACACGRSAVGSGLGFRVKYSKWRTEEQRVKMRVQDQVMITAFYIFILIFKLRYSQFMINRPRVRRGHVWERNNLSVVLVHTQLADSNLTEEETSYCSATANFMETCLPPLCD